jgi:WD40-like Beta Propeller Repeat/Right handed beta helix region/Periplasmic copper-binding protein (NosD)
VGLAAVTVALTLAGPALANTFTVTSAADTPTGGTLREAITSANLTLGTDTIIFDLPFGGQEIDLASPLPAIAESVIIDGSVPDPINGPQAPRIDGQALGSGGIGLSFQAGGTASTVRGLTLTRFGAIAINAGGDGVVVVGNFIGTDPAGATGLGNGIGVASNGAVQVGSTAAADRNVISGNQNGINLGPSSTDADIQGNYIGTNPAGTSAIANVDGVFLDQGGSAHIGGANAGEGNLVSGNSAIGIRLQSSGGNFILGNLIGTKKDGKTALPNGIGVTDAQNGITSNTIGGTGAGQRNIIAFNSNAGVAVGGTGRGDTIEGNAIFSNGGLGIDLGPGGVTANDPTDSDTGGNELQNFPDLATADIVAGGHPHLTGSLQDPAGTYQLDVYASASCDPSGNGEGQRYVGSFNFLGGSFDTGTSLTGTVAPGDWITATVTDTALNDTSEFSTCLQLATPTYTVNTTSDHAPDGCDAADCTFREALLAADASGGASVIGFDFGAAPAPHVIGIDFGLGNLMNITEPVTIDGRQGGAPAVVLDGSSGAGNGTNYGLDFDTGSDGSVVRGLVIQNMRCGGACGAAPAILVASSNNTFEDNYIGTNASGTASAPNDIGFLVSGSNNHIGSAGNGNLITASTVDGGDPQGGFDVQVTGGAGNVIAGNLIGTDITGNATFAARAPTEVELSNAPTTVVGGPALADGNVIAPSSIGVQIDGVGGPDGSTVQNNSIGVGLNGTTSLGFADSWGVGVSHADDVTISDNVIGNADDGIAPTSSKNLAITNNYIGVARNGSTPEPNFDYGIFWNGAALDGPANGLINGNLISKNVLGGVALATVDDVTFLANAITANGTNPGGAGIQINGNRNKVQANTITGNGSSPQDPGVTVQGGIGNLIQQNLIDNNAGLGITLSGGGNGGQPSPTMASATTGGTDVHVVGTYSGVANTTYTLEFFASPLPDPSGFGEGATYVGSTPVVTDEVGNAPFDATITAAASVPVGDWITATATEPIGGTSEFSNAVQATGASANSVTLNPVADAMVDAAHPNTNFGSTDYADVYGGTNPSNMLADGQSYALLRFNLAPIPAGATITNVELHMTSRAGWAQDGDPGHWALFVPNDSWSEAGVDWTNRPSDGIPNVGDSTTPTGDIRRGSNSFGAAGAFWNTGANDFRPPQFPVFPSASDNGLLPVSQAETNFVNRVQTEREGDDQLSLELWTPNCFVCTQGNNLAYWVRYYMREAANPAFRPQLVVQYTLTPATGGISMTASPTARAAGTVPLANVPPSVFFGALSSLTSAPLGSVPLGSVPLGSVPLASVPLGSVPLASVPLASVPLASVGGRLLASIPLSTLPLTPPASWASILLNTPYAGLPLQNVTLGQVLGDTTATGRLNALPLASVDLSRTPLGSLTPAEIGLASTPLGSVPIPKPDGSLPPNPLDAWCAWFAGPPLHCTNGTMLANETLTSAALDGAPLASVPLGSVPLASVPLASVPLGSVPLASVPLGSVNVVRVNIRYSPLGSVPLASVPLGSVPLASVPLASVNLSASPLGSVPLASVSPSICTNGFCTGGTLQNANLVSGLTVGQLLAAIHGTGLDGLTLADLVDTFSVQELEQLTLTDLVASLPTPNTFTYADLLALLVQANDLNWETFDLVATPVQTYASDGTSVHYTATFSVAGNTGSPTSPAKVSVALPQGAVFKHGTAHLFENAVEQPLPGDPITGNAGNLSWTLNLDLGATYRLEFDGLPSTTLGAQVASASITPISGATATAPSDPSTDVSDAFGVHDTPATAVNVTADKFYLSHLSSAGEVNLYTFAVPARGSRTTFRLSHLPADYDLVVYGPSGQQLLPTDPSTPPIDGQPLPDSGFGATHTTDPLAPPTLNDVPIDASLPLAGVSTLRGSQDDAVTVVSNGESGHYTIQVSGFNGAASPQAYMLRAEVTPPPVQSACTPRILGSAGPASTLIETAPGQDPNTVTTLFVVDGQQLSRLYADGGSTLTALSSSLPGFASTGFPAAIVHADADASVRSADASWNACPGDPGVANGVVSAIAQTIRTARATFPNVEYVVLVGGDDALPFARIDDLTTVSNETGYAETFGRASALGGSLANGELLTDDPYGTTEPVPFLGRQLDVPDLVLGRLVESPGQINAQLSAFLATGTRGHLHPTSAQTTGYNFLSDGASGVASALAAVGTSDRSLISDTWTADDLRSALLTSPASILSLNAHADHNRFRPAAGTQLFSADTIRAATQSYSGRLVFSMGCHAGLSVFDAFTPAADNLDWAELWASKGAAAYVANSGFGYGDSDTVAYSEDLNVRFAQNATTGVNTNSGAELTIGEALTVAKQEYKGSLAIVGAYDEKAMAELVFYGLPMYRIGGTAPLSDRVAAPLKAAPAGGAAATAGPREAAAASVFGTDPATGLATESLTLDKAFSDSTDLVAPADGRGKYYQGSNGVIVEHFRPIEPKGIVPITIANAHGALITELTSRSPDVGNFDPAYARPTVDSSATEPEVSFDDVAFPSKLQSVTTFERLTVKKQQLVLAQGQFFSDNPNDGNSTGTQRLFTHEAATVFSSTSTDYSQPTFTTLNAVKAAGSVNFALDVTDSDGSSTVKRVLVAYKDASGPAWRFVELTNGGGDRWSGTGPLVGSSLQYFAQAVDEHGNVGVSTNKGLFYDATVPQRVGNVDVETHDQPPASGWFGGAVTVDVTVGGEPGTAANAQVSVDGGPLEPYTPPLTVSGDGLHTVTATSAGGSASTAFLIDTQPPVVAITTPADGATLFVGQTVTPVFACTDAGSGVQSCTPSSATIDTSTAGPGSFSVTGTDKSGHQSTTTVHYTVKVPVDAFVSAGTLGTNGWYTTTPSVTAQAPKGSVPGPGVVTYTLDGGPPQAYTAPFQVTTDGIHSLVFSANGGTKTLQVKVDRGLPSISGVTPANGASYARSTAVTVAFTCGDVTSGPPTCGALTGPQGGPLSPIASGAALPTGTVGTFTFKVTSVDGAGNQQVVTNTYTVTGPTSLPASTFVFTHSNRIWTYNTQTGATAQLTGLPGRDPATGTFFDDQAVKSPNGAKIVFARRLTTTGPSQLYAIDPDGRGLTPLTTGSGDNTAPAFNAAGTKLAWASTRTGSKDYDVWSATFTGSALTGLANLTNVAGNDTSPNWSPAASGANANLIAFASDRNKSQFEIYTMTTTGASQTRITNDPHTDREPAFSPDGSKIAFSSDRAGGSGGFELYVMSAPNGNAQTRITTLTGTDAAPFWLSTTQLVFASQGVGSNGGLGAISSTGTGLAKLSGSVAGDSNPG